MKSTIRRHTGIGYAVVVGMVIGYAQVARAGWTGSMNGTGFGQARVNVTSSTSHSNTVATTNMVSPSAAMTTTAGYVFGGPLPSGSSSKTLARILGQPGYVWKATTVAKSGDKTDNNSLSNLVIASSLGATTTVEVTSVTIDTNSASTGCPDGQASYTFNWHWSGSDAGTAQRVQWYQFDGVLPPKFNGDLGSLPGAVLLNEVYGTAYSPCDVIFLSTASPDLSCDPCNCDTNFDENLSATFCATADSNKVYMVTDGIAVSLPCPITFNGFLLPIGGADATGGSCTAPVSAFKLCSTIPVKMNLVDCEGLPVTTGNHRISVIKCGNQVCSRAAIDATPKDKPTTGNLFKLTNAATGLWQFNLSTKTTRMTRGTWQIIATLSDGSVHTAYISVK